MDVVLMGGLVLGLVQLVKVTLGVSKRYVPATALVVSLAVFGLFGALSDVPLDWTLVSAALVTALTSVGLWSGVKSTIS